MSKSVAYKFPFLAILNITAYEPGKAGWKLDASGHVELKDGNPVYVDASGREAVIEQGTIARLNGESKTHREAREAAEAKLETFKDIDPVKAREALATLAKLDQKQLIDAGKVDEVKRQITEQFTAQLNEKDKALSTMQANYDGLVTSNLFASSEFLRDRIAVPRDMFEATFKNNVKIVDGKPEFYGRDGNRIMSKARIGEYASTDEAFELLVETHPQKDVILKATGNSGTGGHNNGGNRTNNGRTMKRAEYDRLDDSGRMQMAGQLAKGEVTIVD